LAAASSTITALSTAVGVLAEILVARRAQQVEGEALMLKALGGRVLPFDSAAAREFAEIAASRHRAGQPISQGDARIAAITRSRRAALAMRNVGDFAGCWLELIDPWVEPAASSSNAPANRSTSAPC
jgi:hypothetical protein